ncbi:keratin, type II cytoskeletal 2 epidermal-like [Penaeus chinensis]|uniref:keratin, type II cytoskeletal 2 epidermal-like n=1 Tax=Penaeus chinensis TaxID=139456 RepID=UPI001FB5B1A2|nr:keratin, type II cytoskeletal 2 epidermal-like [Penaeus chinensis]
MRSIYFIQRQILTVYSYKIYERFSGSKGSKYPCNTLPLPNGPVGRRAADVVTFGSLPRTSAECARASRSLGGSLRRGCSASATTGGLSSGSGGICGGVGGGVGAGGGGGGSGERSGRGVGVGVGAGGGAGGGAASGGTVRERAEGGRRGSFRDTPSSTPATATPTSYRRATANHRAAAVVGATGPPPRYEISEYTFEREQPDSPFSDEKDSEEKKKENRGYSA